MLSDMGVSKNFSEGQNILGGKFEIHGTGTSEGAEKLNR